MCRKSSPAAYGRWSANWSPRPRFGASRSARFCPANARFETTWRYSSFLRNSSSNRRANLRAFSRDVREQFVDDRVRIHLVGLAFEVQQNAMAERGQRDRADVLDRHEGIAAVDRMDLAAEHEGLRGARAGAVAHVPLHERSRVRR